MQKKKVTTLVLVGSTLVIVAISLTLAVLLKTPDPISPTAPKKTKAAGRTYTKLIVFNRITPTPALSQISPTEGVFLADASGSVTPTVGTPSPTDINIVVTPIITTTPALTQVASVSQTPIPTKSQKLPESGIFEVSTGLFILAITFIIAAFLF